MDHLQPIAGVSIEKYAELCARMMDTGTDTAAQEAIAAEQGVDAASWNAAKDGWTARMQDASNMGKVAQAFMAVYQAEQARLRGGAPPSTLAEYATIHAAIAWEKGPDGSPLGLDAVLARSGLSVTRWGEINGYWTPKVNDPADPAAGEFRQRIQEESDRLHGITRGGKAAPAAEPDPEEKTETVARPGPSGRPAPEPAASGGPLQQLSRFIRSLFE